MSIIYDLYKQTGKKPCPPGTVRVERCALNLNPNSEDIVTSNIFGLLLLLYSKLWLERILTQVYGERTFTSLPYDQFSIKFWKKFRPPMITFYRTWVSEVDIFIQLLHFVLIVETKYGSTITKENLRKGTRDQVIRYLDLLAYHYHGCNCKDAYFLLITNDSSEPPLLTKYRDPKEIEPGLSRIRPHVNYRTISTTLAHNLGWISWKGMVQILEAIRTTLNLHFSEGKIIEQLILYLKQKIGL
jgi:hypothetical protein